MRQRKIHLLYEYGLDLRPHGSTYIRLLRPLTYPTLVESIQVSAGLDYEGQPADIVIVDRLWRPDISLALAAGLLERVRSAGARLLYALDDDFLSLPVQPDAGFTEEHRKVALFFLRHADGVWVTTPTLQARLAHLNPNMIVVSNALDERLLLRPVPPSSDSAFGARRTVIGCMGTHTHDADLQMVAPALRAITQHHHDQIIIQVVGTIRHNDTWLALEGLNVRLVEPTPYENEYPLFMLWFAKHIHWDIAIAPLNDTPFTQCKSDIKFLDYSAIGAAGIFSQVPAYASTVRHFGTGCLVENTQAGWSDALEQLISDATLRKKMAHKATQYLYANRVLARCAKMWVEALEKCS
jgi:glycosyltransferase involved in cell wall biosynthesis